MIKQKPWPYIGIALIFAIVGLLLLRTTHAATFAVKAQASSAVLSGNATLQSDPTASSGSAVRFGGPKLTPLVFSSPPQQHTGPLLGNQYVLKFNEWNSSRPVTMASDGGANFEIKNSSLNIPIGGAPSGYWEMVKGSSWGASSLNNGAPFPIQNSNLAPNQVTTSATCHTAGVSGAWNNSYDIWFNANAGAGKTNNQAAPYLEMMVWLDHTNGANPIGSVKASNVLIGGNRYNVWFGGSAKSASTVTYELVPKSTTISTDVYPLMQDAIARGYMTNAWYLLDVEFGFEIWNGGSGLGCSNFSVNTR